MMMTNTIKIMIIMARMIMRMVLMRTMIMITMTIMIMPTMIMIIIMTIVYHSLFAIRDHYCMECNNARGKLDAW